MMATYLSAFGKSRQASSIAVPAILITSKGTTVGILPERVVCPTIGQGACGRGISGNPKRIVSAKGTAVTGTLGPPICSGVNDGVATGRSVVSIDKVLDPAANSRLRQAVAGCSIRAG